jgi:uncharacterized protein (PEP-CTERM system associated)
MDMGNTIRNPALRRRYSRVAFSLKSLAAATTLVISSSSSAAEWTFVPSVGVSETYTDNVNLAPKPYAESDYVTEIMPSISIVGDGPHVKFDANFAVQELDYAEKNAPAQFLDQLHANTHAELIDNLFFIDGAASVSQQNISALGPQTTDNIYVTDNRTNVRTYDISPYLSHAFDTFATSELRYSFDSVAANAGGLLDSRTDTVALNINSGKAFNMLGWGLQYNDQIIHYPAEDSVELKTIGGNFSYLLVPAFMLTATTGYDHNDYATLGLTKGYFWTTGFSWAVSERTNIAASVGHRYYGNTFSLKATARSRTTIWDLSYNESISTTQSQFSLPPAIDTSSYLNELLSGTISDPTQRGQAVNSVVQNAGLPSSLANSTNYFTNGVFLQKQLQGSVVLYSPKTTVVLSLFDTVRDPLSGQEDTAIFLEDGKTDQLGGSAVLSRRLSAQTSANVTLLSSRVDSLSIQQVDRTQTVKFGLTKQFSRRLSGTVEIRRDQDESSQAGAGYRENAIAAFLSMQL